MIGRLQTADAATLRSWLADGGEIALIKRAPCGSETP
jgi:hypothetical protein